MNLLRSLRGPAWQIYTCATILYLLVVGWLIVRNDFLPFITDNNETFSSLAHAKNIYEFGFRGTLGLTDEAVSPDPAAGPYIYTHMGNFPRFFALLIYALGGRSPEAQIIATAATVGLAGYLLAFRFLERRTNLAIAGLFCLLLLSDYLGALQWQVVTWQVWRFFFLFASLALADNLSKGIRPSVAAVALLNFGCLFYYDIPFAIFVGVVVSVYNFLLPQHRRSATKTVGVVVSGFVIGAAVLASQGVIALGPTVFLSDFFYTYLARNAATGTSPAAATVREFYRTHDILFWPNFFDAGRFRLPTEMIRAFFRYVFSVYTPFTSSLALILGGLTASASIDGAASHADQIVRRSSSLPSAFLLGVLWCGLSSTGIFYTNVATLLWTLPIMVVASAAIVLDVKRYLSRAIHQRRVNTRRLQAATFWLMGVGLAFSLTAILYNDVLTPFYGEIHSYVGGPILANLWLLVALWIGARLAIDGLGADALAVRTGLRLLIAGIAGYVAVILVIPGYMITTVMNRAAPLTEGIHLLVFVLALFGAMHTLAKTWRTSHATASLKSALTIAPPAIVLMVFGIAWTTTQTTYLSRLPGDTIAKLFKVLREPRFNNTSFIVDGYATPVGVSSQSWAYMDLKLWENRVAVGSKGYELEHDTDYLWFKDRATNPAYRHPRYYVCLIQRDIASVVPNAVQPTCGTARGFVVKARDGSGTLLALREVARDPSPADRWSIIELDWNLPPYLKPLGADDRFVEVASQPDKDGQLLLDVTFHVVERDDRTSAVKFHLYRLPSCASSERRLVISSFANDLTLSTTGVFQVGIELLPTKSRVAPVFFSRSFLTTGNRIEECSQQPTGLPHAFRKLAETTY